MKINYKLENKIQIMRINYRSRINLTNETPTIVIIIEKEISTITNNKTIMMMKIMIMIKIFSKMKILIKRIWKFQGGGIKSSLMRTGLGKLRAGGHAKNT